MIFDPIMGVFRFSTAIPLIKINFSWAKFFSPGFLMYRPSWIRSILSIGPFFILGPRPTEQFKWCFYCLVCLIFNVNQAILKTLKKDIQFSSFNLILGTHSKSIILLEYLNFLSKNKSHPRVCLRIHPNIWQLDHLNSSKLEHLTNLPDEFINNIWTFVLIHPKIWTFE